MTNMAFVFLPRASGGGLLILAHTERAPNDAEWDRYMMELYKHDPRQLRSLNFTDGGAPSDEQRKQINDYLGGCESLCAVVTPSATVRVIVNRLALFNTQIKGFSPRELDAALAHVRVSSSEAPLVRREIQLVRKMLDRADLKCIVAE